MGLQYADMLETHALPPLGGALLTSSPSGVIPATSLQRDVVFLYRDFAILIASFDSLDCIVQFVLRDGS